MPELLQCAESASFCRGHLEGISEYIGEVDFRKVSDEITLKKRLLKNDVLIHGDYCLPNIILRDWKLGGFIDLGESGIGDRHYDLAWGLWTLNKNLQSQKFGQRF